MVNSNLHKTIVLMIGLVAGILSGLLGIGGAVIMVPAMVFLLNKPQHIAQATSLAVIIPTSLAGTLMYQAHGQWDMNVSFLVTFGGIFGGYIGSILMSKINPLISRRIYALMILLIAIKMGVD